ncbi:MAG: TetR/AcrR family transcriptional regulator [Bacteroidetes bacterium]|nr:TetR/AcrR family transcriptional regulator [Bacteroidota bacterium]
MDQTSQRQYEIIQAAGKLLIEKGVKGLTTKNLAAEMGFSESALYRHFKNKEDIIVFLLEFLKQNIEQRLTEIAYSSANPTEKLSQIFNSQFAYFSQNPHFIVAVLSEGLIDDNTKIIQSIWGIFHFKSQLLSQLIEQAKQAGEITNQISTSDILHILLGSFRLMMFKWKMTQFGFNLSEQGSALMQININLFKQ